jgi:multidrug efflux pump subunit AcrB
VTIAGFVPIGFAKSSAGEYTFSIFAVVGIALIVSWFVAVIFAPLLGMAILKAPKADVEPAKPGAVLRGYTAFLSLAMRAKWITIGFTVATRSPGAPMLSALPNSASTDLRPLIKSPTFLNPRSM